MSRIVDAFWTLLRPGWDRRIREIEAELRGLQLELTGALESLNAWAAKEYKRHSRELKSRNGNLLLEGEKPPAKLADVVSEPTSMQRRASIIRRAIAQRQRPDPARGEHDEPPASAREVQG